MVIVGTLASNPPAKEAFVSERVFVTYNIFSRQTLQSRMRKANTQQGKQLSTATKGKNTLVRFRNMQEQMHTEPGFLIWPRCSAKGFATLLAPTQTLALGAHQPTEPQGVIEFGHPCKEGSGTLVGL
eukprot:3815763-Amphidinium_carterae.1